MYLQMLCNTLKAVSLPSVPKARESLEAEVIVSAQPAREWFHRQKDNEGRTVLSSSPASATQVKVFLRTFSRITATISGRFFVALLIL